MYDYLGVGTLLLFALPTSEQVSLGAPRGGHLVVPDGFFGQILPHLLQLIACHFLLDLDFHIVSMSRTCSYNYYKLVVTHLCCHFRYALWTHIPTQHIPSQVGVLCILKIGDSASYTILVFHISIFELQKDTCKLVKEMRVKFSMLTTSIF